MFLDFQIEAQMVNGGVFAEPPRQRGIIPFSNTIYRDVSATVENRIYFYLFGEKKKLTSGICNHAVMTGCLIKWIFTVLH